MTLAQLGVIAPGHGFVEAGVGAAAGVSPYAYAMAGWKLSAGLDAFAQGQASSMTDYQATAGLRWTF